MRLLSAAKISCADTPKVAKRDLELLLRAKAVLLPGLHVTLIDEPGKDKREWKYQGGLSAYLQERLSEVDGVVLLAGAIDTTATAQRPLADSVKPSVCALAGVPGNAPTWTEMP